MLFYTREVRSEPTNWKGLNSGGRGGGTLVKRSFYVKVQFCSWRVRAVSIIPALGCLKLKASQRSAWKPKTRLKRMQFDDRFYYAHMGHYLSQWAALCLACHARWWPSMNLSSLKSCHRKLLKLGKQWRIDYCNCPGPFAQTKT